MVGLLLKLSVFCLGLLSWKFWILVRIFLLISVVMSTLLHVYTFGRELELSLCSSSGREGRREKKERGRRKNMEKKKRCVEDVGDNFAFFLIP